MLLSVVVVNSTGAGNTLPCYACPITTGTQMLSAFDMPASDKAINIGSVAIFYVGFRFFAYLTLRYKNWISK
jgi:hypothetical protein